MEKLLWQKEQDFKYALERALNKAKYDNITIKELLELGFNNNYLKLQGEIMKIGLGFIDENGEYCGELTKKQLNVKVYMKENFGWLEDEDIDGDGYHIAVVYCINKEDEKLFMEMKRQW